MNIFDWRFWYSWRLSWRLWKWRNWCVREDLIFMQGIWSLKTFVFIVLFFSFLSHRKHRTVKRGRGNTKEKFPCDAQLKILHLPIPSSEAIGNLIQFSQFLQWQRRSSSGLWGICPDWGVRNSPVRIAYTVRNMIALRNLRVKFPTVAVLRASCPKISYPPNGHIIEGHLCLIMSGCSLGYK